MIHVGGYHEYIGVFNMHERLLSVGSPTINHDIPTVYLWHRIKIVNNGTALDSALLKRNYVLLLVYR